MDSHRKVTNPHYFSLFQSSNSVYRFHCRNDSRLHVSSASEEVCATTARLYARIVCLFVY